MGGNMRVVGDFEEVERGFKNGRGEGVIKYMWYEGKRNDWLFRKKN